MAQVEGLTGKYKEALASINEALFSSRTYGDQTGECDNLLLLGQIHIWNNKPERAKDDLQNALLLAKHIGDRFLESVISYCLTSVAPAASAENDPGAGGFSDWEEAGGQGDDSINSYPGGIEPYSGPTADQVLPTIREHAIGLLDADELEEDKPLMEAGLDSLSMVSFRNSLQKEFPGVPMPASLLFDHPSIRAVSENIADNYRSAYEAGRPIAYFSTQE